jgi:hypothetical protein
MHWSERVPTVTLATILLAVHAFAQDTPEVLAKKLKDPDARVRREAVETLASANTAADWALVADALADASPLVADEAQFRLASITDPAGLLVLEGKSGLGAKDALVRARAAEAMGRLQIELDATALAKQLTDHDPEVRRAVARALERLADAEHLAAKSKKAVIQRFDQLFKTDKDLDARAESFAARYAVEHFKLEAMSSMRNQKDVGPVETAMTRIEADLDMNALIDSMSESHHSMDLGDTRVLMDESVARPSASSAKSMTALLGRGSGLRMKWAIVDVLQDWSGKSIELDVKKWQDWSDALSDGWQPAKDRKPRPPTVHESPAKLLGTPILSDATAILVDMNGWMSEKGADSKPGKAHFKDELAKMLHALGEDSAFKIIPYAAKPSECGRDWLLPVKLESINDALKCFGECSITGDENFDEALARALRIPGLDTVIVVTDSAPKGASHVHPELVLEDVTQRNRFYGVFIEAILLRPDAAMEEQWKKVCAPSGGRVVKAEL